MTSILVILIILIIFTILIIFKKETSNFTIGVDSSRTIAGITKPLDITYNWPCTGCLTTGGKIKPHFSYVLSDNRCIKNIYDDYVAINPDDIDNYSLQPNPLYLGSCADTHNTMYNTVTGRYILLESDESDFKINNISIYDSNNNEIIDNITSYITNVDYKDSYPDFTSKQYPSSIIGSKNINTSFKAKNKKKGALLINLNNDIILSKVVISHNNLADASSVKNTYLHVLASVPGDVTQGIIVHSTKFTKNEKIRTVYTVSNVKNYQTRSLVYTYSYHTCLPSCAYESSYLFNQSIYNISNNRCVKVKNTTTSMTILDQILSNNPTSFIDYSFDSCSTTSETRFGPTGCKVRFIRLVGTSDFNIKYIKIRDISGWINGSTCWINGFEMSSNVTDIILNKILDVNNTTLINNTSTAPRSMIVIDLGTTREITYVYIYSNGSVNLSNLKIEFLALNPSNPTNPVTCQVIHSQSLINATDQYVVPSSYGTSYDFLINIDRSNLNFNFVEDITRATPTNAVHCASVVGNGSQQIWDENEYWSSSTTYMRFMYIYISPVATTGTFRYTVDNIAYLSFNSLTGKDFYDAEYTKRSSWGNLKTATADIKKGINLIILDGFNGMADSADKGGLALNLTNNSGAILVNSNTTWINVPLINRPSNYGRGYDGNDANY